MPDVSSEDKNLPEAERLKGLKASLKVRAEELARRREDLDRSFRRFRFLTKIGLLRFRYVCGYLAAGFLVSAPLYLSLRMWYQGEIFSTPASEWLDPILHSVLLGVVLLLPYALLAPFTRISWENMRVPEFQKFELSLARSASIAALAYFLACIVVAAVFYDSEYNAFFDPRPAWTNFLLQLVPWLRLKALTFLFKDYYDNSVKKEDLVLHPKSDTVRVATPIGLARVGDPPAAAESAVEEAEPAADAPEETGEDEAPAGGEPQEAPAEKAAAEARTDEPAKDSP